jgi:hypothetical protein
MVSIAAARATGNTDATASDRKGRLSDRLLTTFVFSVAAFCRSTSRADAEFCAIQISTDMIAANARWRTASTRQPRLFSNHFNDIEHSLQSFSLTVAYT